MTTTSPRLAMVAGEASGDLLGAALLASLKLRWPALRAAGIGGPQMAEQGFDAWWPHHKLAVRGYAEVLGHFREIYAIRTQLTERLLRDKPDAFIGVDAPRLQPRPGAEAEGPGGEDDPLRQPVDLGLARQAGREDPSCHRPGALHFPFEPAIYAKSKVNAVYVGHPLASAIPMEPPRAASRAELGIGANDTVVALLPGSRRSEIQYIAPRLLGAAVELSRSRPELRFLIPVDPRPAPRRRAAAPAIRARPADHAARRACARGARRLRRGPGGQRHGDAGGSAVQAADGRCLCHARAHVADGQADDLPAVGLAAEHPAA
jgi:lipid-A-disaccharide synthase